MPTRISFYGIIESLLLGSFAAGFCAYWLNPEGYWLIAFIAMFLTDMAILFLILATIFTFKRHFKRAAVYSIFAILVFIRIFQPQQKLVQFKPDDLKILLYNLYFTAQTTLEGQNYLEKEWKNWKVLEQMDIVALNEQYAWLDSNNNPRMTLGAKQIYDKAFKLALPKDTGFVAGYEQPVFFNSSIKHGKIDRRLFWDITGYAQKRTYLIRVPFVYQGKKAALYVVHLASLGAVKPWSKEERGLKLLLSQYKMASAIHHKEVNNIKKILLKEKSPYILMGDFNATMHQWEYKMLGEGLQDVYLVAGQDNGATFSQKYPFVRIDYVFASKEWLPVSAQVFNHIKASDHLPLVARLRWR